MVVGDSILVRRNDILYLPRRRRCRWWSVGSLHRSICERPLPFSHATVRAVFTAVGQLLAGSVGTCAVFDRRRAAYAYTTAAGELVPRRLRWRQCTHSATTKERETYRFSAVAKVMRELLAGRRALLAGTLTQDQTRALRLKLVAKLDWGNR
ncbi:jg10683 [Pararge aegeria aegeria]|uniref:Jg10683 protein n=1 Tax=Pararge aegeria aegeria TaxID=348720 RepID=A0A8S4RT53_9NEOP|nr:jg10683 [Pararge aegeria aegeria]